jgi:hypothetical protein
MVKKWKPWQRDFIRTVSLRWVVRGTYNTIDRGGSGSWRETITTGRVLAASPRSASQISPGLGFVKQVEDLLFGGP